MGQTLSAGATVGAWTPRRLVVNPGGGCRQDDLPGPGPRAAAFQAKKLGAKVTAIPWSPGTCGGVTFLDAPAEATATAALRHLGSVGNIRTQTARVLGAAPRLHLGSSPKCRPGAPGVGRVLCEKPARAARNRRRSFWKWLLSGFFSYGLGLGRTGIDKLCNKHQRGLPRGDPAGRPPQIFLKGVVSAEIPPHASCSSRRGQTAGQGGGGQRLLADASTSRASSGPNPRSVSRSAAPRSSSKSCPAGPGSTRSVSTGATGSRPVQAPVQSCRPSIT
jgi:hypothetical protein